MKLGSVQAQFQFAVPQERPRAPELEHLQRGTAIFLFMKETSLISAELREEYFRLKAEVMNGNPTVHRYLEALIRIRDEKLYLVDCQSWQDWCEMFAGTTANAIRQFQWRERQKLRQAEGDKLISETSGEPIEPKSKRYENVVADKPKPKPKEEVINVSARVDPKAETFYSKPPPVPMRAADVLAELTRCLDRLLKETGFALNDTFRRCVHLAHEAANLMQPALPGMEEIAAPSPKGKASLEQCLAYAAEQKLEPLDAQWFFDRNQTSGWKINGRAIQDWRACMRAWKAQRFFPSQKQGNGSNGTIGPAEMMVRKTELDNAERQIARIKNQYEGHQTWSPKDRETFAALTKRRAELKEILGMKV